MNTFLPYPDFLASARTLDSTRLLNQRNEALIVYKTLTGGYGPGKGWPYHPCTLMWSGHEDWLAAYHDAVATTYNDHAGVKQLALLRVPLLEVARPTWLGDPRLHSSHRAALLFKNTAHYEQFGWTEMPAIPNKKGSLPYYWPVTKSISRTKRT
jgi:hypothetical protein